MTSDKKTNSCLVFYVSLLTYSVPWLAYSHVSHLLSPVSHIHYTVTCLSSTISRLMYPVPRLMSVSRSISETHKFSCGSRILNISIWIRIQGGKHQNRKITLKNFLLNLSKWHKKIIKNENTKYTLQYYRRILTFILLFA